MSERLAEAPPAAKPRQYLSARLFVVAGYAVLGTVLLWSRLTSLGKSYWLDESVFVAQFVRRGPGEILGGPDLTHELYGLLAWATGALVGESETAYRLLSVLPFLVGVAVVAYWLHTRIDAGSGIMFLFLATVSPLLLDITRQARGYGLAFLAMSVLVVCALEASRTGRTSVVVAACVAGVAGTWTLPQFGIAFFAVGGALVTSRELRRTALIGVIASAVAIAAWYAPHLGQIRSATQIEDGLRISTVWLVSAPIDQILLPALLRIEGVVLLPGVVWLPLVILSVVVMATSPLLHSRTSALVLASGPIATILVLWVGQAYVIPRYLSFLLVPLFVLLASGTASILARIPRRQALVRAALCLVAIGLLALNFAVVAPRIVRLPKEAMRDAAAVVQTHARPTTPVLTRLSRTEGFVFYLKRPVTRLGASGAAARVCERRIEVAYVVQPFALPPLRIPCLTRPGARHFRLEQYTRGNEIDVWIVPPGS